MTTTDAPVQPGVTGQAATPPPIRTDRVVLAGLLLVVGIVGTIGRLAGLDRVGAVGLVVFVLMAPGAAVLTYVRTSGGFPARLCLSFGISFTVVTALSTIEVAAGVWAPIPSLATVCGLSTLVLIGVLLREGGPGLQIARRAIAERRPGEASSAYRVWVALSVVGMAVCVVTAYLSHDSNPPVGGLLRVVNPVWYLGVVLLVAASAMALLSRGPLANIRSATSVSAFLLPVALTLTPSLIYRSPRSQSGEKHIQLSELIAQSHHLKASETIYNDWPGLFTASAWLKDFAGIGDLISLAAWWPVLLVLFRVAGMRLLAGNFISNPRVAWLAATVVFLATPGGIDYYSPQSIGYTVGLVTLWVATTRTLRAGVRNWLLFVLIVGVDITHQLTPYILAGALVAFAVFKLLHRWWLPAIVIVPTLLWTGIHFDQVRRFISPGSVGSGGNFALPSQRATSNPQLIVHAAIGVTVIGVLIVGLLAAWTFFGNLRTRWAWAIGLSSLVGFGAVVVNAYGNEGTFRAVFFALPWLGVLAGITIAAIVDRRRSVARLIVAGAMGLLIPLNLLGVYLLDSSNVIRSSDRAFLLTARAEAVRHPSEKTIIATLGDADYPGIQVAKLDNFGIVRTKLTGLVRQYPPNEGRFATELASNLDKLVADNPKAKLYVFASPAITAYENEYGQLTSAQAHEVLRALRKSPLWTLTTDDRGTVTFRLNRGRA